MKQPDLGKGASQFTILAILARGPRYGYDIARPAKEQSQGQFLLKEGTLYIALHRLFMSSAIQASAAGRILCRGWSRIATANGKICGVLSICTGRWVRRRFTGMSNIGSGRMAAIARRWKFPVTIAIRNVFR